MRISVKVLVSVLFLSTAALVSDSCKKESTLPNLTTAEPSNIAQKTVTSGGTITSDGGEDIVIAGICWSTTEGTSVKDKHTNDSREVGSFTSNLTGLTPDTKYYIKAYAYTKAGVGYGNEVSFTTLSVAVATLTTTDVTEVTSSTAISGGDITADGGGTITDRGVCWGISTSPTIEGSHLSSGTGTGTFTSSITGLLPGTTYYLRAYATNSAGTTYGNEISFTTILADASGNVYERIVIGEQIWMDRNLNTTMYSNGDIISSGIYVQGNDLNNATIYGRLYTWTVAIDGRNVCPAGWHVPSEVEWNVLLSNVTSPADLKEQGLVHWFSPNTGATNSVSFTALPAGYFDGSVTTGIQAIASFWFRDEANATMGRGFKLYYNNLPDPGDYVNSEKNTAFSVRCLKDQVFIETNISK